MSSALPGNKGEHSNSCKQGNNQICILESLFSQKYGEWIKEGQNWR